MLKYIPTLVLLFFGFNSWAETFDAAVKQELSYINLQFESLQNQKLKIKRKSQDLEKSFENKIQLTAHRLAQLQTEVDELQFEVSTLERTRKGLSDRTMNISDLYNKSLVEIMKTEAEMNFQLWKPTQFQAQSEVNLQQFNTIVDKINEILTRASQAESLSAQYFDESGALKKGKVYRLGRVGALIIEENQNKILGPSPEGLLRIYETVNKSKDKAIRALLFQDLNSKVNLKVQANLWDKLADLLPGFILFLIFSLVLGLFSYMAKE